MSDMENSELKEQSRHSFRLWAEFRAFMRDRFSLEDDKASQDEVAANISKGTEFRGVNLWVLICATMVASLGLNVNSAAVIIGAMCISPIMGPIMGIGFSLGINDFDLLKKSVRNFVLMFVVAISTSTLFFFISPLGNASSELLARTTPTTYDVLIAFFGGMVITTLVELVGGYILYKMFHTRWWDYSMYRFNLGGFICPQFSLLWGLGSVLLMVVVHPLLSKPSAAIPTLVLIWLDVIFGGLFLADLIVSAIQAVGFSKQLARIDELRKAMRTTSDALTEVIGTSAMTMDTLLDEQKLQLTLAAMEGATNAAELRDQLRELAGKAGTLRDTTIRLSKQRFFGTGRLLRAFPDMVPDRREALASLRVGLTKATARAKAAAKQAVKTGKNAMKKEDK